MANAALMLALGALSFLAYAWIWNWKYSLLIVVSLFVHEMGHVWGLWHYQCKVKGMYAIPLLGAAVVSRGRMPDQISSVTVFLMGPAWGYGLAGAVYIGYMMTGSPVMAGIASWMVILNLINLAPISGLDGGQAWKAIVSPFPHLVRVFLIGLPVAVIWFIAIVTNSLAAWIVFGVAALMTALVNLAPIFARREQQKVRDALARVLVIEDTSARGVISRILYLLDRMHTRKPESPLERSFLRALSTVAYDTRLHLRVRGRILHLTRKKQVDAGMSGGPSAFLKTRLAEQLREEQEVPPVTWTQAVTALSVYCMLVFAMISLILLVRDVPGAFDALVNLAKRK